jgi:SAM-dependent methyltransferase
MDPEYARSYRELYERHWWWRAREDLLVETLRGLYGGRCNLKILDVGCGSGLFFSRLSEFGTAVGVEPDPLLAEADTRHRDRIHAGDLSTLPAGDAFDLILLLDVLEHIDAPETDLARAFSILKSGGLALVTVPAFQLLWSSHDEINHHKRRYTASSLTDLIRGAGGHVHWVRYFFHWTFPAKLCIRLLEKLGVGGGSERVPPHNVNRALYTISRLEQRAVGPLHLPFGTSVMAVCSPGRAPNGRGDNLAQ